MPTWLYRASNYKAGPVETWNIAEQFGFIHRDLYCRAAKTQRVANVGSVALGDLVHLYFTGDLNLGQDFGLFRVVDPKDHSQPAQFAAPVPKSALYTIATGTLHDRLRTAQYEPDPGGGGGPARGCPRHHVRAVSHPQFPGACELTAALGAGGRPHQRRFSLWTGSTGPRERRRARRGSRPRPRPRPRGLPRYVPTAGIPATLVLRTPNGRSSPRRRPPP